VSTVRVPSPELFDLFDTTEVLAAETQTDMSLNNTVMFPAFGDDHHSLVNSFAACLRQLRGPHSGQYVLKDQGCHSKGSHGQSDSYAESSDEPPSSTTSMAPTVAAHVNSDLVANSDSDTACLTEHKHVERSLQHVCDFDSVIGQGGGLSEVGGDSSHFCVAGLPADTDDRADNAYSHRAVYDVKVATSSIDELFRQSDMKMKRLTSEFDSQLAALRRRSEKSAPT
jgi:hypothetical protein